MTLQEAATTFYMAVIGMMNHRNLAPSSVDNNCAAAVTKMMVENGVQGRKWLLCDLHTMNPGEETTVQGVIMEGRPDLIVTKGTTTADIPVEYLRCFIDVANIIWYPEPIIRDPHL